MTLLTTLSRYLCGLALAGAIFIPLATAAELEGTPVSVDPSAPVEQQLNTPVPSSSPPPPLPEVAEPDTSASNKHFDWRHEEQQRKQNEAAQKVHDEVKRVNDEVQQIHNQQNWQRDFDRGMQQAFESNNNKGFDYSQLVPITAIVFLFGGPVFLFAFFISQHYRAKARRHQQLNANIDKLLANGRDIPVELLRGDDPKAASEIGDLNKGIRNLFLGAGWLVFLTIAFAIEIGALGFIWIALGGSQILIWYLNKPGDVAQTRQAGESELQAGPQD